jgi:hypothetical protein
VVIGLPVVHSAVSADIPTSDIPEVTDTKPAAAIPAPLVPDTEKSGSMEELVPASGEELDSGQGNDTPLVVVPPVERPSQRYFLSSFKLPTQLTFAGVSVPMDNWQVRERIEYEFYQFLAEEGESIIMAKRTGRCFPPVEKQLAQSGLPDDLKYMLLVESKCISAAFSKAKASGPWQFIGSTGKRYKLYSNQWRDDRRNLEMSTEAAIKYLRYLKQDLGDWFLAMAAYNAGEDRIRKLLKEQRITDYWKLHYVRETMRYVPRIIAAKEIYSQPEKYLGLTKKDLYAQLETETVAVTIKETQRHLASIAQDYGSYFLELKMLNPEIRKDSLPKGTHSIRVPKQACPFRCLKQDTIP